MKKYRFVLFALALVAAVAFIVTGNVIEGLMLLPAMAPVLIKTSKQLKEERGVKLQEYNDWLKEVEKENRDFNDDEKKKRTKYLDAIEAYGPDIEEAEKHERAMLLAAGNSARKEISDKDKRDIGKYSFLKACRSLLPGQKLEGIELEMHQQAIEESRLNSLAIIGVGVPEIMMFEKRGQTAGTDSEGGYLVPEEVAPLIEGLLNKMVLKELGADFWTGLKGNMNLPKGNTVTTAWEGETDENVDGSITLSNEQLTPHRLGSKIPVSKQLLLQTSPGVEASLQRMITSAIASAVENAAIQGAGSSGVPQGITNTSGIGSVVGGTNGLAPAWSHIVALEREVAVDNADIGALAYLTNPKVRGKLKAVAVGTDQRMIWGMDNALNGYKAGVTTNVPSDLTKGTSSGICSAIIFGNFMDLIIAQWGGMDILSDPYTLADFGQIKLVVNSWWDIGTKRAVSFAAMLDALTT